MPSTVTTPAETASPRIRRRQARTREAILSAATARFAEKSVAQVSVEEIIEAADVSRGTFYKLFQHKEAVLSAILRPLIEAQGEKLSRIDGHDPWAIINEILNVYIEIWRDAPAAFSLVQREAAQYFHLLETAHGPVVTHMRRLFRQIEPSGLLRAGSAEDSVVLMARSAVVILRVFADKPDWEERFISSMHGLLLNETQPDNGKDLT